MSSVSLDPSCRNCALSDPHVPSSFGHMDPVSGLDACWGDRLFSVWQKTQLAAKQVEAHFPGAVAKREQQFPHTFYPTVKAGSARAAWTTLNKSSLLSCRLTTYQ